MTYSEKRKSLAVHGSDKPSKKKKTQNNWLKKLQDFIFHFRDVLDMTCLNDSSTIQENLEMSVISSAFYNRGCWKEQPPVMC